MSKERISNTQIAWAGVITAGAGVAKELTSPREETLPVALLFIGGTVAFIAAIRSLALPPEASARTKEKPLE